MFVAMIGNLDASAKDSMVEGCGKLVKHGKEM
jgi:hypothetical protein